MNAALILRSPDRRSGRFPALPYPPCGLWKENTLKNGKQVFLIILNCYLERATGILIVVQGKK